MILWKRRRLFSGDLLHCGVIFHHIFRAFKWLIKSSILVYYWDIIVALIYISQVLKICNQSTYILRMLRIVRDSMLILAETCFSCPDCFTYFLCITWSPNVSLCWPVWQNAFLKRANKFGLCSKQLLCSSATALCNRMQNPSHCLHIRLPSIKYSNMLSGTVFLQTVLPQCRPKCNLFKVSVY